MDALLSKALSEAQDILAQREKARARVVPNSRIVFGGWQNLLEQKTGKKFSTALSERDLRDMLPPAFQKLADQHGVMIVVRLFCDGYSAVHVRVKLEHLKASANG